MAASAHERGIPLVCLGFAAALLPLVTLHLCWAVALLEGQIPQALPYWEGATSISRTGHTGTAYFLFKAGMLPAAVIGVLFWGLNGLWLERLGARGHGLRWLLWLGLIAGVALAAYTVVLGHTGDSYRLIRRTGVVLYLSLTYIAELLVSAHLRTVPGGAGSGRRLLNLCQLTLVVGIGSLIMDALAPDLHERFEDAFEWWIALLLNLAALWIAVLWRRSGFRGRGVVGSLAKPERR
ncbi:hypothetical protein EZI54_08985 [Marinobacter halodurans]|uniref:DUF998 domain-containing protein n=1 Tax=Marinobacter halodurans TaxID=2528979 RepID=A0ABY1ZNK1_9GAMM|nr:hypothetical protein [Marinobacter halodurans]TBW56425.1 hypothetical protein EZI54_08985 [Marinobacter halodurans]